MSGGRDDILPAASYAVELAQNGFFFSLPLGFGLSLIAGAIVLRGTAQRLAIGALLLLIGAGVLFIAAGGPYGFSRQTKHLFEGVGAAFCFAAVFAIYLRHTYFPTKRKSVNLPATLGFGLSFGFLILLLLVSD